MIYTSKASSMIFGLRSSAPRAVGSSCSAMTARRALSTATQRAAGALHHSIINRRSRCRQHKLLSMLPPLLRNEFQTASATQKLWTGKQSLSCDHSQNTEYVQYGNSDSSKYGSVTALSHDDGNAGTNGSGNSTDNGNDDKNGNTYIQSTPTLMAVHGSKLMPWIEAKHMVEQSPKMKFAHPPPPIPKRMADSFHRIILPFTTDQNLTDQYINAFSQLRIGKFMEDLDVLSTICAYKHASRPQGKIPHREPSIVTASVDKIVLEANDSLEIADYEMFGHVTWTGRSSMEISIEMRKIETQKRILEANFTMVATDQLTHRSVAVNPLIAETEEERKIFKRGEAYNFEKKIMSKRDFSVEPPDQNESQRIHQFWKDRQGRTSDSTFSAIPMSETKTQGEYLMQPESRNLHTVMIFGGYLMRLTFELAHLCAADFSRTRPQFVSLDSTSFKTPVPVGCVLKLNSMVTHTSEIDDSHTLVHVRVRTSIHNVSSYDDKKEAGEFCYTFLADKICSVYPETYDDCIEWLRAERRRKLNKSQLERRSHIIDSTVDPRRSQPVSQALPSLHGNILSSLIKRPYCTSAGNRAFGNYHTRRFSTVPQVLRAQQLCDGSVNVATMPVRPITEHFQGYLMTASKDEGSGKRQAANNRSQTPVRGPSLQTEKPRAPLFENINTIPNYMTFSRLLATPIISASFLCGYYKLSFALLLYSCASDFLDGFIARSFGQRSVLGTVIDPLADKFLITMMTVTLALGQAIPLWLAALIIGRDVALGASAIWIRYISLPPPKTWMRYWDMRLPSAEVRPLMVSKINTVLQLGLIAMCTVQPLIGFNWGIYETLYQVAVATTTVWSGLAYLFSRSAVKFRRY